MTLPEDKLTWSSRSIFSIGYHRKGRKVTLQNWQPLQQPRPISIKPFIEGEQYREFLLNLEPHLRQLRSDVAVLDLRWLP